MKKLLSPHTLLTSIAFVVTMLFLYEQVVFAADATPISRYDNSVQERFTSTIDYVNEYRLRHGRPSLQLDVRLQEVAHMRAQEIASTNMFTHFDAEGRTFFKYLSHENAPAYACENLSSSNSNASFVPFHGWKKSPPHNACMLDDRMNLYGIATVSVKFSDNNDKSVVVMILGVH